MVKTTQKKVNDLISRLHHGEHSDDMTKNGFYKLPICLEYQYSTRLQKSTNLNWLVEPSSRAATALLTERISSFVDTLLLLIVEKQKSFIKDTTDFISFIEKKKIGKEQF